MGLRRTNYRVIKQHVLRVLRKALTLSLQCTNVDKATNMHGTPRAAKPA